LVEALVKLNCQPLCLVNIHPFNLTNVKFKMSPLELVPPRGPWYPRRKGVGLVWVNSTTFIFNCYRLINSPTSGIDKTQATTTWSSSTVSMLVGPGFLDLVFPYKWLDNEVRGMFECILAFLNKVVLFSIASMASSNVSLIHLPLVIRRLHLLLFFSC